MNKVVEGKFEKIEKKVNPDVSEDMLAKAKLLRRLADGIESAECVGIAIAYIDTKGENSFNVGTAFASQYGCFTLGGALLQLQHIYAGRLCEAEDAD